MVDFLAKFLTFTYYIDHVLRQVYYSDITICYKVLLIALMISSTCGDIGEFDIDYAAMMKASA
jgi:hypothetical protein